MSYEMGEILDIPPCPECGGMLSEHGFHDYYCVYCNSMYNKAELGLEGD